MSTAWLAAGAIWAASVLSPSWLIWFLGVALVGAFIPGAANQVTVARAYLAGPAFLYAVRDDFGAVAVLVALAGLTDLLDGTVARRFGSPTNFGGGLDPVVDCVFMGALGIGLAVAGVFPMWLAAVVFARYLLPALAGGALIAAGRRPQLRHTLTGQISTTLNLVLLGGAALLRGLKLDPGNLVTGAELVLPIATIATFVHLGIATRRPVGEPASTST